MLPERDTGPEPVCMAGRLTSENASFAEGKASYGCGEMCVMARILRV